MNDNQRKVCYTCGSEVDKFLPYREGNFEITTYLEMLQITGSDTENFFCPNCRCTDRDRHLLMYFDRLELWSRLKGRILHIAPETKITQRIMTLEPVEYIRGDQNSHSEEIISLDVTHLQFADNYFDFIICNHVLEHILDLNKGLLELFRVLKPGGMAVLQTPYSELLHQTLEDPGINTDELRLFFYAQEDHVRMFGKDLFEKIKSVGFEVDVMNHEDVLSDMSYIKYGINPRESLITAGKQ